MKAFFAILFIGAIYASSFDSETCTFTNNNGKVFKMTDLKNHAPIKAYFRDDKKQYILNICKPCTDCEDIESGVAVCQKSLDGRDKFSLGLYSKQVVSELPDNPDAGVEFTYTDGTQCNNGPNRKSHIIIRCALSATTPTIADVFEDNCEYFIYVDSADACYEGRVIDDSSDPNNNNEESASSGGLSAGSVLLIIFFSFVAVYLAVGIFYNYKFRGKSGIEMVPNWAFWSDLPSLCKDGFSFMVNGFKKPQTYDSIE